MSLVLGQVTMGVYGNDNDNGNAFEPVHEKTNNLGSDQV